MGEVLDMAREALQTGRHATEEARAAAAAALESERSNIQMCAASVEAAASDQVAAENNRQAKKNAHDSALAAVQVAQEKHLDAEAAKENVVNEMAKQRSERDKTASILDGTLSMLRDGGWGDAEDCEDYVSAVKDFLEGVSAEKTLIAAFPPALRLRPEQRRPFDKFIEQGVIDVVTAELKKLEGIVASGAEHEEHVTAEALGLWAILDLAKAAKSKTELDLTEACDGLKDASRKHSNALEAVEKQNEVVAEREVDEEVLRKKIEKFDIALETLERLRNVTSNSTDGNDDVIMMEAAAPDAGDVQMTVTVEPCATATVKDCGAAPTLAAAGPLAGA